MFTRAITSAILSVSVVYLPFASAGAPDRHQLKSNAQFAAVFEASDAFDLSIFNIRGTTEILPSPDDRIHVQAVASNLQGSKEDATLDVVRDSGSVFLNVNYPQK